MCLSACEGNLCQSRSSLESHSSGGGYPPQKRRQEHIPALPSRCGSILSRDWHQNSGYARGGAFIHVRRAQCSSGPDLVSTLLVCTHKGRNLSRICCNATCRLMARSVDAGMSAFTEAIGGGAGGKVIAE